MTQRAATTSVTSSSGSSRRLGTVVAPAGDELLGCESNKRRQSDVSRQHIYRKSSTASCLHQRISRGQTTTTQQQQQQQQPGTRRRSSSLGDLQQQTTTTTTTTLSYQRRKSSTSSCCESLVERRRSISTRNASQLADLNQFYSQLMKSDVDQVSPDQQQSDSGSQQQWNTCSRWKRLWSIQSTNSDAVECIRAVRGLCFNQSNQLIVTDDKLKRLQVFDITTRQPVKVLQLTKSGPSTRQFQPAGVTEVASTDGYNWLAVTDINRVVIFDESTDGYCDMAIKTKTNLYGIAVTERAKLVLTDVGQRPAVSLHDFVTCQQIREFGEIEFIKPLYTTVNVQYSLTCVSDCELRTVSVFDRDGHILLTKITGQGQGHGEFVYPAGLASVDGGQRLLIADSIENVVTSYDLRTRRFDPLFTTEIHGVKHPGCVATNNGSVVAIVEDFSDTKVDSCQLKLFKVTANVS